VFFFSSRGRHTRFSRDWSSDVCSSDLEAAGLALMPGQLADQRWRDYVAVVASWLGLPLVMVARGVLFGCSLAAFSGLLLLLFARSEERRVGKEGAWGWWRLRCRRDTIG